MPATNTPARTHGSVLLRPKLPISRELLFLATAGHTVAQIKSSSLFHLKRKRLAPSTYLPPQKQMEFKPKATVCAVMLMLLLLSSYEGGHGGVGVAEARVCTGKSQHHSFPCISDKRCSQTCTQEHGAHWTAGYCHIRRCVCQRAC